MAFNLGRIFGRPGRSALALAGVIALVSALACGGGDETAKTTATSAAEQGGSDLAGGEKAPVKAMVSTGELPEGYPSDIPLLPDAKPARGLVIPNQSGLVTFHTSASPDDVFSYFKNELPNHGWKVETEQDGLRSLVRGTKGDRKANITISSGTSGTEFAVTFEGS